jgi:hypothetical protein
MKTFEEELEQIFKIDFDILSEEEKKELSEFINKLNNDFRDFEHLIFNLESSSKNKQNTCDSLIDLIEDPDGS